MTRNMLSALEHDGANPSVGTLRYLSEKLNKPVSYFLGEDVIPAAHGRNIELARTAYEAGAYRKCLEYATGLSGVFGPEAQYLQALSLMGLARGAIRDGRMPYARELLAQARGVGAETPYFEGAFREWTLLMAKAGVRKHLSQLTGEDEMLVLRSGWALENGQAERACALLEAVENRDPDWYYLRGEVYFKEKDYVKAAECYRRAEEKLPRETCKRLEICYRELGDYKMAYYYATKGK